MKNLVIIQDNQAITTSLKVAEIFGKEHKTVIRKINELVLECRNIDDLREHKIVPSQNPNNSAMFSLVQQNMKTPTGGIKSNPMYVMNRDGFTLLAMGFTGKKALQFKLAYINAFNQMEATIKQKLAPNNSLV